jgi:hypothetical protein
MSRQRLADAFNELAIAADHVASELRELDSPADRAGVAGTEGAPRSSVPVPSFDELPPEGFMDKVLEVTGGTEEPARAVLVDAPETSRAQPVLKPQVDAGLGKCPVHGKPWKVKAAGVSKAGKPFNAFWRCAEKDGDAWCDQKPQKIWKDLHPIPEGAAA